MPAQLHPLVQRFVHHARAAGATVDAIDDWAELTRLNDLALTIDSPDLDTRIALLWEPIAVGNLTLRRLSLGVEEWLAARADWFPDERTEMMAVAYAMSHPAQEVMTLGGPIRARIRMALWALRVNVPYAILTEAVQALMPRKRPEAAGTGKPQEQDPNAGYGPIVALLIREYGHDADYWLFEAPADFSRWLVESDFLPRQQAEERAYRAVLKNPGPSRVTYQMRMHKRFIDEAQRWLSQKTGAKS